MRAIDTTTDINTQKASALKQQGVGAVFGYLGPWSKCLTPERVKVLKDAGLLIGTLFEGDGKTFSAAQGKRDALMAKQHAESIGQPYGTGICTCVDYDAQQADYPAIQSYVRAWRSVMDGYYRTGFYAGYDALKAMRGEVSYLIEPSAWSGGQKLPGITAYQNSVSTTLCGIGVDIDEVYDTSILWGGRPVSYPTMEAEFNGQVYKALDVNGVTYPIWTIFRDAGANLTKVAYDDVEIDGKRVSQVGDGTDTYIQWDAVPLFDAQKMWVFTKKVSTPSPAPTPKPAPTPLPTQLISKWQKYVNSGKSLPQTFPDLTPDFDQVIGNQYVWNGCTSWATMADFIRVRVAEGYPVEKYSRLALWWMARKYYGQMINDPNWVNENQGDIEDNVLQTLVDFGPMLDQYDPESAETDPTKYNWVQEYQLQPPDKWMANEKLQWSQVYQIDCTNEEQKLADVLDALANGHAVLASVTVFKSIFNAPNGHVPMPGPDDQVDGGHEVNLTCPNPSTQEIKFPQSWGPEWGDNGNGYFSYDYLKKYATELFVIVPIITN